VVGASSNPLSGVTMMSVLFMSILLLFLMGGDINKTISAATLGGIAIIIAGFVTCAGAVSCDNLQDLKAGQLVGATPWKQQVMLVVGVIVGAALMAPIFNTLYQAYGIGDVFPRAGMDPTQAMGAPKAAMMAIVAKGVFARTIDWNLVSMGAVAAIVVIALDEMLRSSNVGFRMPILPVAMGVYFPLDITLPILAGGMISYFARRRIENARGQLGINFAQARDGAKRRGILMASGLVAGESLVGILVAAMIVSVPDFSTYYRMLNTPMWVQIIGGGLAFLGLCTYLFKISASPHAQRLR